MNLAGKYSYILGFTSMGFAFSNAFPILIPLLCIYFFVMFWIEKYRSNSYS